MGFMLRLFVCCIADYRDELGDCHPDRTFCRISMGDNGNTEMGDSGIAINNRTRKPNKQVRFPA